MNAEKEVKIWHKLIPIFILTIGLLLWSGLEIYKYKMYTAGIRFLQQYYDSYESAKEEIDSAEYFELDWLKTSAMTMIESGGHRTARSSVAYGYKQLHRKYITDIKGYVHKIAKIKMSCSVYYTKFNIWGGNFLFRDILDNMTSGVDKNDRFNRALLIYNMGYGGLKRSPHYKVNYAYCRRWSRWYTKLKYEWDDFPKW